ncbi:MAG TPA: hypothetical protein VHN80_19200 [Kineosporiaceae bacterium]|nr:hypothetical protein [Kineosporiaceae bacterium]
MVVRWRGLVARWRRPDGTALNYLVMAFTAVFCVVVAMWLFPEALVGGRQNAVAWVSAAAFTVVGIYVLGRGTVTRVALHPLAWTAIVGGNSIVASFEDPSRG